MESGVVKGMLQLIIIEVHAVDLPVPGVKDAADQGIADKTVNPQD